jgi:hypothetical protein
MVNNLLKVPPLWISQEISWNLLRSGMDEGFPDAGRRTERDFANALCPDPAG